MSTPDIGATIHKIPPLAWVGAVGVGIFFYMRNKNSTPAAVVDTSNGVGTGAVGGSFIPVAGPTAPGGPTDIEGWGISAVAYLIGAGYNPLSAATAIRKFIDGQNYSSAEKSMIDAALIGVPLPSGVSIPVTGSLIPNAPAPTPTPAPNPTPPPPQPAPTPAPTPAPPAVRHYTVQKWPAQGSTLWGIATIMYGNGTLWPRIYNANRGQISNPNLIHPGQVLVIP